VRIAVTLCLLAVGASAQQYDLLLKGGHVIDPRNRISAVRDVAISQGRIAAVAETIPAAQAKKTISVAGLYVTPGLVDIHVHVFAGTTPGVYGGGDLSVQPDAFSFRSGVTTMVDAGSSGWRNFPEFRKTIIDRARTRVLAFINISAYGMRNEEHSEQNVELMDPQAVAKMIEANREVAVGVKSAHFRGPEWASVDKAVQAATPAGVPVMVDFGTFRPERPFNDLVLKHLRPGDIYTHFYLGAVPMLDDQGRVQPYLFEARKRGIIFDAGHGGGSFLFRQAVPAIKQGLVPDSISTDLHATSMNGGMKDMLNVMSKFLNMGMALDDVILRSTWNPAREIKREELGHLTVGAPADVAVLRVENGNFGFVDVNGARMAGTKKLVVELTVRDGLVMWDLNGLAREDWSTLGKYNGQGDPVWDGVLSREVRARK
jgi:dihydroorotase